jgi:rhamnulokinase
MTNRPAAQRCLALDLGAESGRAVVGAFDGDHLAVEEVHRFPNRPVRLPTALHWDILSLLAEVRAGIAAAERAGPLASLAVDTWGVDFGLLDERGALLGNPVHYRDSRTDGMLAAAFAVVRREQIFEQTGIQFLPINSLYQLLALARANDRALEISATFLTIPDLLNYWLTAQKVCEFTNASTTQCLNPHTRSWARELLRRLGVPDRIFPEVLSPGTTLGPLLDEAGTVRPTRVVLAGSHDTASAVAGTPLRGAHAAYISSGTWSLVGVEVTQPVITSRALDLNLTNEGGVGGTFRLLRNVMGLWLVQGLRRGLAQVGISTSYEQLTREAAEATPFQAILDPDAPEFLRATDMAQTMREFCFATGQAAPETPGGLARVALEGLALRSRWVVDHLEEVTGQPIRTIHIVGGGAHNRLLCQMTADATGRPVLAGPVEATALGNIIVQLIAAGALASLSQGRDVVARSFSVQEFVPLPDARWQDAYGRFTALLDESARRVPAASVRSHALHQRLHDRT